MTRLVHDFDIIISGRSFVGHAQAVALVDALGPDFRIALLDRTSATVGAALDGAVDQHGNAYPQGGRAFAISAGSQRMLEVLGLWSEVRDEAHPVRKIVLTDSELGAGVRRHVMSYDNTLDDHAPASFILQSDILEAALRRRVGMLQAAGAVTVINDASPKSIATDAFSTTTTLNDGTEIKAPLAIAADGRRSQLRKLVGIKLTSWSHNQIGIVTQVRHSRPHDGRAIQHFLPSGPFAILPLPGERSCVTWSEAADNAQRILAMTDAEFLEEVKLRFGAELGVLELVGPRQSWPLETHVARSFVADRLALVGDAARGVHPIAGQGLNLGLRDVAALTEVVAEAVRVGLDPGAGDTLAAYQQWRRFDSVISTTAFDGLNRLFSNDGVLLRAARDAGMGLLDRMPWAKQQLVNTAAGMSGDVPKLLRGEAV